jgi:hypothetical protein
MHVDDSAYDDRPRRRSRRPAELPGKDTWATRSLTPDERQRLREHFARHLGRDSVYLAGTGLLILFLLAAGIIILNSSFSAEFALHRRWWQWVAWGVCVPLSAALGFLMAWVYDPRRMRYALRPRRPRVPSHVWIVPVEVRRSQGMNREGQPVAEMRCHVGGQIRTLPLADHQWDWFPDGPAQVEILPGNRQRLYRFHFFETHSVEVYPEVRCLGEAQVDEKGREAVEELSPGQGGGPGQHGG